MEEMVTKENLRQFGIRLVENIRSIVKQSHYDAREPLKAVWLKTKAVRKLLDISPGSVQNLRISGSQV